MNHIHKSMSRGSIAITIFIFFVTAYASIPITTEMYITVINILYRILLMRKLISLFLSSFSSTISSAVSDFERLLEIFTIPSVKTITFKTIDFTSIGFDYKHDYKYNNREYKFCYPNKKISFMIYLHCKSSSCSKFSFKQHKSSTVV